jgi:hypothetical protein
MHKVDPEGTLALEAAQMASYLGVDISRETFNGSLLSDPGETKKVFPNTPKGFEQLVVASKPAGRRRLCLHGGHGRVLGGVGALSSRSRAPRERGQSGTHQSIRAERAAPHED